MYAKCPSSNLKKSITHHNKNHKDLKEPQISQEKTTKVTDMLELADKDSKQTPFE